MTPDMLFVFATLGITIALFVSDRIRMDLVALMVVVALALSGIITPAEAVAGFGEPVVIMIAALFVVGEALFRTGIAAAAGNWLLRMGGSSETRLLLFLLPVVALLSAFMSSTGAVALLIPVVLSMARRSGMQPSQLLMPLAFAALIGGMLTLIGTPPNIIVSSQMRNAGLEPFGFFDFTPLGLAILIAGMGYLILVARKLLPERAQQLAENTAPGVAAISGRYALSRQLHKLMITPGSPLAQKTPAEAALRTEYDVTVIAISRSGGLLSSLVPVLSNTRMQYQDQLIVYADEARLEHLCETLKLKRMGFPAREISQLERQFGMAEVLLPPESPLCDRSIKEGHFRERYGLSVLGIRRDQAAMDTSFTETQLTPGDTLLLAGSWEQIRSLQGSRELVVLQTPAELEEIHPRQPWTGCSDYSAGNAGLHDHGLAGQPVRHSAGSAGDDPHRLRITAGILPLSTPPAGLIAGMLPLALPMARSAALPRVADHLVTLVGHSSPLVLCASLFMLTSLLSQFISNTATTVLLAPIAITTAQLTGVNPEPVMMTVAIAASTAFATPIASPVNTLVLAPGNYRFADFARVGIPLQLLALALTLILTPLLFPF